ncbi:glycosyltransferase family 52, partial [Rodentibacter pneumotropicus]
MNKFDKVVIISSYRVLVSYVLINKYEVDNILFISDSSLGLKDKLLLKNIVEISWPKNYFYLILYKIYYFLYFSILLCFFCKNKKSLVVYGADHIVGAKFFLKRFPFYVIEDGRANYISSNYIRSFRNKLFSIPSFGMHKTVKG